jgi:hypothetical protein
MRGLSRDQTVISALATKDVNQDTARQIMYTALADHVARCHFSLSGSFFPEDLSYHERPYSSSRVMAWRNQGITGSNNIPLGSRRRGFGDEEDDSRTATPSSIPDGPKRGRSPVRGMSLPTSISQNFVSDFVLSEQRNPRLMVSSGARSAIAGETSRRTRLPA